MCGKSERRHGGSLDRSIFDGCVIADPSPTIFLIIAACTRSTLLSLGQPYISQVNFSSSLVTSAETIQLSPRRSSHPQWLSGVRRSRVHSLMIARRSLCPEKLGSNPGQGSKGINLSGLAWSRYVHYCDKETLNSNKQTNLDAQRLPGTVAISPASSLVKPSPFLWRQSWCLHQWIHIGQSNTGSIEPPDH